MPRKSIYITELTLSSFRNYESLELTLGPGMVLFQGANGQGKSNLLEAVYLLAVAKSPRASTDRELVRFDSESEETYSRVSASVHTGGDPLRVQIDFRSTLVPVSNGDNGNGPSESISVQKYFRVNGVPRRASDVVGQVNAVMFSADDLEIVYGTPSVRRRYLDILISQLDRGYLKALQRYGRVMTQRNHLLRSIKEGSSRAEELEFWDDELIAEGKQIIARRAETMRDLNDIALHMHQSLTGDGEPLALEYRPNVQLGDSLDEDDIASDMRKAMVSRRQRELSRGVTVTGPHRDDMGMLVDGMEVSGYASRGQARTVVLAMKLAEAALLKEGRKQEPVLLLDDVFSELDAARRVHVLETVSSYEQSFITTTDVEAIDERFLGKMSRFVVRRGSVQADEVSAETGTL